MGWFGLGKKDRVIDLAEHYRRQQEQTAKIQPNTQPNSFENTGSSLGFLGSIAGATPSGGVSDDVVDLSSTPGTEERKKRLAKRLMDMTEKLEDLNNQIYHLQQRIEVLERKSGVSGF
ncbi:MAG: hypothetical protein KKF48_01695 [Nanoarchaeota archaeon]|nr:hypothetical protein [Nanoarchaeota archaeon]MBU1027734.1 hypothetical protein [Nanoarchaeota archaeon]